jgi:hypothetical protein
MMNLHRPLDASKRADGIAWRVRATHLADEKFPRRELPSLWGGVTSIFAMFSWLWQICQSRERPDQTRAASTIF